MIILLFFLGYVINNPNISIYFIVIVAVLLNVCDYIIRSFFEWRYLEEPKQFILTITDILLVVISTVIVVNHNLLGLRLYFLIFLRSRYYMPSERYNKKLFQSNP